MSSPDHLPEKTADAPVISAVQKPDIDAHIADMRTHASEIFSGMEEPVDVSLKPALPARLDPQKVQEWLAADNDPAVRAMKEKILSKVQHVPFDQFQKDLAHVVEKFTKSMESTDGKYAVLWDYKPHASRRWTYELAKPLLKNEPVAATYFQGAAEAKTKVLQELIEKGVQRFVIFDDASYSGSQMGKTIREVKAFYDKKGLPAPEFTVVTPYVTPDAAASCTKQGAGVISAKTMPYMSNVLSPDDLAFIAEHHFMDCVSRVSADNAQFDPHVTLTFFDHRVADDWSFNERLQSLMSPYSKPYGKDDANPYSQREEAEFKRYFKGKDS